MNKNSLHIIILAIIFIVYILSAFLYGLKNITLYNILLFLFASPLVEEFIFRGIIQQYINRKVKHSLFVHISIANIITSFIFALLHMVIQFNIINLIFIFISSLYLGYVYDLYKSIKQPFFIHSILNIIVFINYPPKILNIFI